MRRAAHSSMTPRPIQNQPRNRPTWSVELSELGLVLSIFGSPLPGRKDSRKDQALEKEVALRTMSDPSSDPTTGADLSGDNMPAEWQRDHIHTSTGPAGNFGGFHPIRHKTGALRVARFIAAPKQKA